MGQFCRVDQQRGKLDEDVDESRLVLPPLPVGLVIGGQLPHLHGLLGVGGPLGQHLQALLGGQRPQAQVVLQVILDVQRSEAGTGSVSALPSCESKKRQILSCPGINYDECVPSIYLSIHR